MKYTGLFVLILMLSGSCSRRQESHAKASGYRPVQYSKMFGIAVFEDHEQLYFLNNTDTLWSLRSDEIPKHPKLVILSSVYAGFIAALDARQSIVGIDNYKFYSDSALLSAFNSSKIKELGEEGQIRMEALLHLKPDLLIGSSYLNTDQSLQSRLGKAGIKSISCDNYKEEHPLARAEWIKFFGFLLGKQDYADSVFLNIEKAYNAFASSVKVAGVKPIVLTDALYMDAWNVPGAQSYTARLIADAGGQYVFGDIGTHHTYPLNFESVLRKAKTADYWIHVNTFKSREEMLKAESRYALFNSMKENRIYNNNKRENAYGGNDFWSQGVVRPDLVLHDLIVIFSGADISGDKLHFYTHLD